VNIDQLLASPEGKTLEFKRDLSSPKPILRTLVVVELLMKFTETKLEEA